MKTLLLTFALLALLAGGAFAQTPTDVVDQTANVVGTVTPDWYHRERRPVQPVPEPGTMALASMGLIALGAAAKKRRK